LVELLAEVDRIMDRQPKLNSGGPRHDGTGVDFTTTDAVLLNAADPRAALGARYPVSIEYAEIALLE